MNKTREYYCTGISANDNDDELEDEADQRRIQEELDDQMSGLSSDDDEFEPR